MKKNLNKKLVIKITFVVLVIVILIFVCKNAYNKYRYDHAIIKIDYYNYVKEKDNSYVKLEVYKNYKLKDIIKNINGKVISKNININTKKLGYQNIKYEYINDENIKLIIEVKIKVVDEEPPIIYNATRKTVYIGETKDLEKELFCGDNYDDKPKCTIEGNYDLNIPGTYKITYKGEDSSHNKSESQINLIVREKDKKERSTTASSRLTGTDFSYYKDLYKNNNKIGIDVSYWQGDIDYKKVKKAGANFVMIRVGYQKGINGEYILDKKFKDNIEGFNKVKVPVGIYFFSYADTKEEALKEAKWVVKQIKNYKIDYPVSFDWENWNMYNEFNLSFYHLTEIANTFMDYIKKEGYTPFNYSSKHYLENIWMNTKYKTWLAHYTSNTDYKGEYKMWQLTDKGLIDGISSNNVDIDIYFTEKD